MALSYSAILRVPLTFTFTTLNTVDGYEFTSGGASGEPSVVSMLTNLKASHETYFGGTYSWVITNDGTYDIYTIAWTGLTRDPATQGNLVDNVILGNPTFIYAYNDADPSQIISTQYFSTEQCEATGSCIPCPPSVNPEDATDCPSCYDQSIAFCDSVIEILGLDASTEYDFKITDQATGKVYNYTATTDGFGEADLLTADFPTGLFTPYNGAFTISIFDVNGDPVILTYGYVNYSCIELTVTNTTTIA